MSCSLTVHYMILLHFYEQIHDDDHGDDDDVVFSKVSDSMSSLLQNLKKSTFQIIF